VQKERAARQKTNVARVSAEIHWSSLRSSPRLASSTFFHAITPALCRAARGLLDMTQIELAAGASVSKNTIVDFEKGRSTPVTNNLAAIQRVLEEAGVEFTNGDAPGLRLRKKKR
jgi:DNA-binding XRE family transcriptional regulator